MHSVKALAKSKTSAGPAVLSEINTSEKPDDVPGCTNVKVSDDFHRYRKSGRGGGGKHQHGFANQVRNPQMCPSQFLTTVWNIFECSFMSKFRCSFINLKTNTSAIGFLQLTIFFIYISARNVVTFKTPKSTITFEIIIINIYYFTWPTNQYRLYYSNIY